MYTSRHRKAQTVHIRIHVHSPGFTEFQGISAGHCQSQFCSDQPVWCALLLSASGEIEERKWERVIERGVEGCVTQQATGISMICMDLPLTNTWQRERGWRMVGSVFLHVCRMELAFCNGVDSLWDRNVKQYEDRVRKIKKNKIDEWQCAFTQTSPTVSHSYEIGHILKWYLSFFNKLTFLGVIIMKYVCL